MRGMDHQMLGLMTSFKIVAAKKSWKVPKSAIDNLTLLPESSGVLESPNSLSSTASYCTRSGPPTSRCSRSTVKKLSTYRMKKTRPLYLQHVEFDQSLAAT